MKSYLSLIPISAKVHKHQNRMTLLCIICAVFLVTAIFSMADMGIKMEISRLTDKHGEISLIDMFSNTMVQTLLLSAIILFVLVLIAGVLMISSSINTNVAQRTKFFGMMRCIGMSREQIIRFVRLEALNWCKIAVPIGIACGIVFTWILCIVLHFMVKKEFSNIPLFNVSVIGIICGGIVGVTTVLIAAGSPGRRAAKVSPVIAVSGNNENVKKIRHSTKINVFRIETELGIHHAVSAKKNLILMTGSFALSIILFFSFSVLIDFIGYLIPQSVSSPDIIISSNDNTNCIGKQLADVINNVEGVERVYGRKNSLDISAQLGTVEKTSIDIISYDEFELRGLIKDHMLKKGSDISKLLNNGNYVLATWDKGSSLEIGDKLWINNKELEIAGLLKYDPFSENGLTNGKTTIITTSSMFDRLTGIEDYSIIMAQVSDDIEEDKISLINSLVNTNCTFQDKRDQQTRGIYMAFVFCVCGFLAIIILVTVLNITNSISMSVAARIKQYGAMRAVGMDERQITKMIISEAATYATIGTIVGCVMGILISRWIYTTLISSHFSYAMWKIPFVPVLGIIIFVLCMVLFASYIPSKRIRNISVTETINRM